MNKPVCSICGKPVLGNIDKKAKLTCGVCLQKGLRKYEANKDNVQGEIREPEQLKKLRQINALTQKKMAKKLSLLLSNYKKIESSKRLIPRKLQRRIKILIENEEILRIPNHVSE